MLDKYEMFLNYFSGREDYIAFQGENYYYPINQTFSIEHLNRHLNNLATYGIYVLNSESKCNLICIDIDIPKSEIKDEYIIDSTLKFNYLKEKLSIVKDILFDKLSLKKEQVLFEDTGGRGYHIWIFFSEQIEGIIAKRLYDIIKSHIDFEFEFFPKQAKLSSKIKFGNLIKLPLGKHQKYKRRSYFFEFRYNNINIVASFRNNFNLLKNTEKISKTFINQILEKYSYISNSNNYPISDFKPEDQYNRIIFKQDFDYLFEKCSALNSLKEKAKKGNLLNRKELFHLSNTILSVENGDNYLIDLLKKSFGSKFSIENTTHEIISIKPLYPASCQKLIDAGICKGFCHPEIERQSNDNLLPNPNPTSFWLKPAIIVEKLNEKELFDKLTDNSNIIRTYNKLKKYHKNEDVGFFDEFDYQIFEENLDINSRYLSKVLKEKKKIQFIGYIKYEIPKKVDENEMLQFRQMVYSNISDQIAIQTIFNILSPILEKDFQNSSCGYRVDPSSNDNIFQDWREYYPRFRNKVLNSLHNNNVKYYICCDIEKFYDNIDHNILIEQLKKYITDNYLFSTAKEIIKLYNYNDQEISTGLPQGPAYARVLANLYLNDFDKEIIKFSSGYYRYVDDFFLFFNTKEAAENGLNKVIMLLNELKLNVSNDEEKKPIILDSINEERILKNLDSLQYGIFEEFKFIPHVKIKKIKEFYTAIDQQRVLAETEKELLDINKILPSILYIHSPQYKSVIDLRLKIFIIINYLVEHNLFYPKRLKIIFHNLIPILKELNQSIPKFYSKLHNTHKIYFLIDLYDFYKKDVNYKDDLIEIINNNLNDDNNFILGFSIGIHLFNNNLASNDIITSSFFNKVFGRNDYFPKLKLLSKINYFEQNSNLRAIIRDKITPQNNYLEKNYLLKHNLLIVSRFEDSLYISSLLSTNSYFLLPSICRIFINLQEDTSLFKAIITYIKNEISFKEFAIKYITELLFNIYRTDNIVELKNLEQLYNTIVDDEIKEELITYIHWIQRKSHSDSNVFNFKHVMLDKYNGCYYFKPLDENTTEYNAIELIPISTLENNNIDLEHLVENLNILSKDAIVPKVDALVNTTKKLVTIKYLVRERYKSLNTFVFNRMNENDIYTALIIINNIYKKANKIFRIFNVVPLISSDNLLVNLDTSEIQFKYFGKNLASTYKLKTRFIDTTEMKSIPIMIFALLQDLFTLNEEKELKTFRQESKIGLSLFLWYFISRKQSFESISSERYSFIIDKITDTQKSNRQIKNNDFYYSVIYFEERFKTLLVRKNHDAINWCYVSNSVKDLFQELAITYKKINFTEIDFQNKMFGQLPYSVKLHITTKKILNLCLNRINILGNYSERNNVLLFEIILYYSALCIELISLLKSEKYFTKDNLHNWNLENISVIEGFNTSQPILTQDKEIISFLGTRDLKNQNIFDNNIDFTLKRISIYFILKLYPHQYLDNIININNNDLIDKDSSRHLGYLLLNTIPNIEKYYTGIIDRVIREFKNNLDSQFLNDTVKIKEEISDAIVTINKLRAKLKIRRVLGSAKFKVYSENIEFYKLIFKTHEVSRDIFSKTTLSATYPYSNMKCTIDKKRKDILNMAIPIQSIVAIIKNLKSGKIFNTKIFYLYSNKSKLIWDIIITCPLFILTATLVNLSIDKYKNSFDGFYTALYMITGGLTLSMLYKIFKDKDDWFPKTKKY